MRSLIGIAVLCLGVALADYESFEQFYEKYPAQREIEDRDFRSDREYRYFYDGQVMTGIPGSSKDHSSTRIQCMVIFQVRGTTVHMKLNHVRFGKLIQKVPHPRVVLPFSAFEEVEMDPRLKEHLLMPLRFTYTNGLIHDIQGEPTEKPWSVNIKRGILNMFQVNLKEHAPTDTNDDLTMMNTVVSRAPEQKHNRFYRVMERTLEGECETLYAVDRIPCYRCDHEMPVLNVTKSINFERCNKRPQIKYNWRFGMPCPTCDPKYSENEKYLKSSTVMTYNITGTRDNFLIETAKVESHYSMVMYNEDASIVNTYVNQTLVLIKTAPIQTPFMGPSSTVNSDSDLMYNLQFDIMREKWEMEGESRFFEMSPYSEMPEKLALIEDLLRKLVRHMVDEVDTTAPKLFSRLVTIFRSLTKSDLERVHQQFHVGTAITFTEEEKKKVGDILVNVIALCGTHDCVHHLVEKIESRQLKTWESVNALRQFVNIPGVSKPMIEKVMRLCESTRCQESFALKQQCYLALGSMMNTLCKPNEDQWAIEFKDPTEATCTREEKQRYIEFFERKIETTESWEEKILCLKALGNTGIDLAVYPLQKIIEDLDRRHSNLMRSEAIIALRELSDAMPRKIQKILMPVYMNRYEEPYLRMAAAFFNMRTQPDRPTLEIMAKNLNTETSHQVASFVYTLMMELANSTQPCYKKLATDLKLALRFTKRIHTRLVHSSFWHLPLHTEYHKMGVDFEGMKILSNESFIPTVLTGAVNMNSFGFFENLFKVTLRTEKLEPLLYKFMGPNGYFRTRDLSDILSRHPRNINSYGREIDEVFDTLKIQHRRVSSEPKAYTYFTWDGQDVAFIPFSTEIIRSLIEEGSLSIRELESKLRSGWNFNWNYATFLIEKEYKIPTAIGLPLVVKHKAPLVTSVKGRIQLNMNSERLEDLVLTIDAKPSIAVKYINDVEIWCPVVNSGLKITAKAKGFLPIKAQLIVDLKSEKKEIKVTFKPPTERRELLTFETEPVVYTFRWPSRLERWIEPETKVVMGEEMNRMVTINKHCCESTGIKFEVKGHWHKTPFRRFTGTPFCPMSGPNKISLIAEPGYNVPDEIEFKLFSEYMTPTEESFSSSIRSEFFPESDNEEWNTDEMRVREREQHERSSWDNTFTRNMKTQVGFELVTRGSNSRKYIKAVCTTKQSEDYLLHKLLCKLERSPMEYDPEPFEVCAEAETVFPSKPYSVDEVRDKKVLTKATINWGRSCSSDRYIKLRIQGERSRHQERYEQRMMEEYQECKNYRREEGSTWESPITCYDYLAKASQLLKYKLDIEYNQVPIEVKNMTTRLWRLAKYYYFWQNEVADIEVRNPENKIMAVLRIDPYTMRRVNVTVKMPRENCSFFDVPLPSKIRPLPLNTKTSFLDRLTSEFEVSPVCKLHTGKYIKTFDDNKYRVPLTTCWSVLAKDCSEEERFSVLVKKVTEESPEKIVKILTPTHKLILRKDNIEVNGEVIRNLESFRPIIEGDREVLSCEPEGPYVKCTLKEIGLRVYFDGYSVNVKISPFYLSRQCGLCGHYDNEMSDEYRSPKMEEMTDVRDFFARYTIKDSSCEMPTMDKMCEDEWCTYKPEWNTPKYNDEDEEFSDYDRYDTPRRHEDTERYDSEESKKYNKRETTKPLRLNKIKEQLGEICFSKLEVPVCPDSTIVEEYTTEMDVPYVCLPRDNYRTHELMTMARRAPLEEVKTMPVAFTVKEKMPTVCRWLY